MEPTAFLPHLGRELAAFRACLDADLATPVETCGDWTLYDLADHLGGGNLWSATAVRDGHGDLRPPAAPRGPAALAAWFDDTAAALLDALDTDPAAPAWTFHPPHTAGFWMRRRFHETLIHRWDAQRALGTAVAPDPALAADGIAEVFEIMAPRQIARGRATEPAHAIRVHATDTGDRWTHGPGEPVGEIAGPATDLLLMLWGRLPRDHASLTRAGDRALTDAVLDGPLVP
jgi:uncharacterized protein (TIGR03083 family)